MKAVEVIMEHGVPEDRIIFINLVHTEVLCYAGIFVTELLIDIVTRRIEDVLYPIPILASRESKAVNVFAHRLTYADAVQITGWIDQGLNEKAYIIPGLGDFGERRYCSFALDLYLR